MLNISLKETIRFLRQKDYDILASLLEDTWENHPDKIGRASCRERV